MLSQEENTLLTRVGPGTPMGNVLRRYWLPACLSEEVARPDGPPIRLRLLSENLVAFRESGGRVGIMAEHCPHRRASLVFGRNEESGLRCLYHGWKIGVDGSILETPSEPEDSTFRLRLRHLAYPTEEAGGVVWVYMGPPEYQPVFPRFEWTTVDPSHRVIVKLREECNWVQALEGAIDSAHSSSLHQGLPLASGRTRRPSRDTAPRLETEDTAYGFRYAAIRRPEANPDRDQYVRVTLFAMPFHCFVPPKGYGSMHIFVPIDDEHTFFYGVNFSRDKTLDETAIRQQRRTVLDVDIDRTFRKIRTLENLFLQDREAMEKNGSYTGIDGVPNQDMAMQESMGAIVDRSQEHLGASDVAIIRMRRLLLESVRRLQQGQPLPGLDPEFPYQRLRSDAQVIAKEIPWQSVGAFAGEFMPSAREG